MDFKEKVELFNSHFATQCSLISNSSKLPSLIKYLTGNRLFLVSFCHDKVAQVIQILDPNKTHGHDNISIHMVKICGPSIYKPLEIIFNECLKTGVFPSEWKLGNIVPVHKKGDKRMLQNYRPVSLLSICGKILERLMKCSSFLLKINLFPPVSLVLNWVIPVSINFYLLLMRYIVLLMKALKLEVYSSILQRYLRRCGMMVSFLN